MRKFPFSLNINKYALFFIIIFLVYAVIKAINGGNDINVYLYASKQFFAGENIYTNNLYNNYLYSPLFAVLLGPMSFFNMEIGRVIWAILNAAAAIRLWFIAHSLINESFVLNKKTNLWWTIGLAIISLGILNHNLILGQITIVILWLTFEGLYQIMIKNMSVKGALLIALGINIKIIPLFALFYLFFKKKYKALAICGGFLIASLFIPALIVGVKSNNNLLQEWYKTINPSKSKYVFENNSATISLNSVLPAYFYDFNDGLDITNLKRQIVAVPHDSLVIILQSLRLIMVGIMLWAIFYKRKMRENGSLFFFWEFSIFALITLLLFPHQQKYAMLYFIPAGSYFLLYLQFTFTLKKELETKYKVVSTIAITTLVLISIMGRDIVGNLILALFDYYRSFGLINILFLTLLLIIRPDKLELIYTQYSKQIESKS